MTTILISILISIFLLVGIILLQFKLSKSTTKWLGLILPLICFAYSLLTVASVGVFTSIGTTTIETQIIHEDGTIETTIEYMESEPAPRPSIGESLGTILPIFVVSNIPTLIFLAIYGHERGKIKKNGALIKMTIQDLE